MFGVRMTLTPAFGIGVWNAWILVVPYLLVSLGLPFLLAAFQKRKAIFWKLPSYTRVERIYRLLFYVLFLGLVIYCVFLPLASGTVWFYVGLCIYLVGWAFLITVISTFHATSADKPNTTGIYRFSRHPWYVGMFFIVFGTSIACASWVFLLGALLFTVPVRNALMIVEERKCCERFGDAYQEYMKKTPRWIGLPKSGSNKQP